jgi:hypothetical protein
LRYELQAVLDRGREQTAEHGDEQARQQRERVCHPVRAGAIHDDAGVRGSGAELGLEKVEPVPEEGGANPATTIRMPLSIIP